MARKPKADTGIDNKSKLIEALRFAAFVTTGTDTEDFAYVRIKDKLLTAADNVICMGGPVDEDLEICLHGSKLKAALEQCGPVFKITEVDRSGISVRSDKFRAVVPAMEIELMSPYLPDAPVAKIDDRIKNAFELCNPIVPGKGDRPFSNSASLNAGSCIATNGALMVEYWHGIDLPSGLNIPKRCLTAVTKQKKPLAAFGFSNYSATFYFDDGSFIKTKLEDVNYPNTDRLFDGFNGMPFEPMPPEFFKGIDAVDAFAVDGTIYIHDGYVATHNSLDIGASYRVDGIRGFHCYGGKYWQMVKDHVRTVHFSKGTVGAAPVAAMFYGENIRGIIAGKNIG